MGSKTPHKQSLKNEFAFDVPRKAESGIKVEEERYRDFLDNANDLIQIVAPDGSLIYVNRAWLETLEYELEEIARLNIFELIHPDCRKRCKL